jgi:hypothetical protein
MANKRISQLPFVGNTGYTSIDIMPIVNYDVSSGTTKHTPLIDLQAYIVSGVTNSLITGGTYSGGTLVLSSPSGTINVTGFTTGSTQLYEVGSGIDSTQRVGVNGDASGNYSLVGGGTGNTASGNYSFVGGGINNTSSCGNSFVGGGYNNTSSSYSSTVSGGRCNTSSGYYSTVSGGYNNTSSGEYSTIGGGFGNTSSGHYSTVSGGRLNTSSNSYSTVSGGRENQAGVSGTISVIYSINYTGVLSSVYNGISPTLTSSGLGNGASFNFYFDGTSNVGVEIVNKGSGYQNGDTIIFSGSTFSPGGVDGVDNLTFQINTSDFGYASTIGGGLENTVLNCMDFIGGGYQNTILNSGVFVGSATIGGGCANTSTNYYTFNGGGINNKVLGEYSSIVGGEFNLINSGTVLLVSEDSSNLATITGTFTVNPITQTGYGSGLELIIGINSGSITGVTINNPGIRYESGDQIKVFGTQLGSTNSNYIVFQIDKSINGNYSNIGGGRGNTVSNYYSNIGGGVGNTSSGYISTIGGGGSNTVIGDCGGISAGVDNKVLTNLSYIGGGKENYAGVSGQVIKYNVIQPSTLSSLELYSNFNTTINYNQDSTTGIGTGVVIAVEFGKIGDINNIKLRDGGFNYEIGDFITISGSTLGYTGGGTPPGNIILEVTDVLSLNGAIVGGGIQNTALGSCTSVLGGYRNTANCAFSFVGGGSCNKSLSFNSTVSGGYCNTASGGYSTVSGGYCNTVSDGYSVIGGGFCNTSSGGYVFIGSGKRNTVSSYYGTISGGYLNKTSSGYGETIAGGVKNTSSGGYSSIGGGIQNTSSNYLTTISGGRLNTISAEYSTIGGGRGNVVGKKGIVTATYNETYSGTLSGYFGPYPPTSSLFGSGVGATFSFYFSPPGTLSNIYIITNGENYRSGDVLTFTGSTFSPGGVNGVDNVTFQVQTVTFGDCAIIGGGYGNTIFGSLTCNSPYGRNSTISGGYSNTTSGNYSTVSGGYCNRIQGNSSTIGGGCCNSIPSEAINSTISGGYCNRIVATGSSLVGGYHNLIGGTYSVIGGGCCNTVCGNYSFIGSGSGNTTNSNYTTISGGYRNTLSGCDTTISGGRLNTISSYCGSSTIGGGKFNTVSSYCGISTIGGGISNTISSYYGKSTIGGGISNTISSYYGKSTIGGGVSNEIFSYDGYSTIAGGGSNLITTCGSGILGGLGNTVCHDLSFVIGNGITSTAGNTTHVNCLNIKDLPVDPVSPIPLGTLYRCTLSGNTVLICI